MDTGDPEPVIQQYFMGPLGELVQVRGGIIIGISQMHIFEQPELKQKNDGITAPIGHAQSNYFLIRGHHIYIDAQRSSFLEPDKHRGSDLEILVGNEGIPSVKIIMDTYFLFFQKSFLEHFFDSSCHYWCSPKTWFSSHITIIE